MWVSKESLCYSSSVRVCRHCLHQGLDMVQYVEGLSGFLLLLLLLIKSMVGGLKCEGTRLRVESWWVCTNRLSGP